MVKGPHFFAAAAGRVGNVDGGGRTGLAVVLLEELPLGLALAVEGRSTRRLAGEPQP
jgi:hypothetical protein